MGIWDLINSAKTAVNRVVEENLHNGEGRAQIGRIATSFIKNAAVYGFHEGLRWIPGGIMVHNIVKKGLKDQHPPNQNENKKSEQPAVVVQMQTKMKKMQEEMKEMHEKMEKMQEEMNIKKPLEKLPDEHVEGLAPEKMEKMHKETNTKKPLEKLPDEPVKGSAPLKIDPTKVSIHSRL